MDSAGIGTWVALLSCPLLALVVLVLLFRGSGGTKKRPRKPSPGLKPSAQPIAISSAPDCVQLRITAQQLASTAGVAVLAARASAKEAADAAAELARLTAARDDAVRAHESLQSAIATLKAQLKAAPEPPSADDPAQREVARAALSAYRRGDISVDELHAVWKRVDGWDEEREERERELNRLRTEEQKAKKSLEAAEAALVPARRKAAGTDGVARLRAQEAAAADRAARSAYAAAEDCRQRAGAR